MTMFVAEQNQHTGGTSMTPTVSIIAKLLNVKDTHVEKVFTTEVVEEKYGGEDYR